MIERTKTNVAVVRAAQITCALFAVFCFCKALGANQAYLEARARQDATVEAYRSLR